MLQSRQNNALPNTVSMSKLIWPFVLDLATMFQCTVSLLRWHRLYHLVHTSITVLRISVIFAIDFDVYKYVYYFCIFLCGMATLATRYPSTCSVPHYVPVTHGNTLNIHHLINHNYRKLIYWKLIICSQNNNNNHKNNNNNNNSNELLLF
jgi:hypothetical protein